MLTLDVILRILAALAEAHVLRLQAMSPEQIRTETDRFNAVFDRLFGWAEKLRGTE